MLFSDVWSENASPLKRLMKIHSNPPILYCMALILHPCFVRTRMEHLSSGTALRGVPPPRCHCRCGITGACGTCKSGSGMTRSMHWEQRKMVKW